MCVCVCVYVCACIHNVFDGEHAPAFTSMGFVLSASEPLSFGKTSECSVLKSCCGFSQVSLSLSFLLCVF